MSFLQKLFGSRKSPENEGPQEKTVSQPEAPAEPLAATAEMPAAPAAESGQAGPEGEIVEAVPEGLDPQICLLTDMGCIRTNNEDSVISKRPADPELAAAKGTVVIVADGMGGASAGEVASGMAIRLIPEFYYASKKPPALALKEALEQTSAEIHRAAQADPEKRGMGTTCVAIAIIMPEVYVAYVGDSRLYRLRDGSFYQETTDHTVVNEMVQKGILTREQAKHHEERNVLSLSMGGRPEIQASYLEKPLVLLAGDRLLLCSDGLHDLVSDGEMQAIITDYPAPVAVKHLIEAARRQGGHDNITAALVHVVPKTPQETDSKATREFTVGP